MKSAILPVLTVFMTCSLISACNIHHNDTRVAACNKLKSQIVFSGATSDQRQAEIERSQRFLQQQAYDENCHI